MRPDGALKQHLLLTILGRLEQKTTTSDVRKLQRMTTQQPAHLSTSELASFLRGRCEKAKAKFGRGKNDLEKHRVRYATNLFTGRKKVGKNMTLNALPKDKSKARKLLNSASGPTPTVTARRNAAKSWNCRHLVTLQEIVRRRKIPYQASIETF